MVEDVAGILQETGLDPRRLELEITESVVLDGARDTIEKLEGLRELGVELSIDDFGTGYSAMSYLKHFPVDSLKIDRSFIEGLGRDPEASAIVAAIVTLARALGIGVVAEGWRPKSNSGTCGGWTATSPKATTSPVRSRLLRRRPCSPETSPGRPLPVACRRQTTRRTRRIAGLLRSAPVGPKLTPRYLARKSLVARGNPGVTGEKGKKDGRRDGMWWRSVATMRG